MRPTFLVLLCFAYISTCAAEGLKDPQRSMFVDGAFKACFKAQTEMPENKGIGSDVMAQYCLCFANKFADALSPADLEALAKGPEPASVVKATLISSLSVQCQREVLKK